MPASYPRGTAPCVVSGMSKRQRIGQGMFVKQPFTGRFSITGVTRDSAGAPLATCTVHLYQTADDLRVGSTVSDSMGNYSFSLPQNSGFFYAVAVDPTGALAGVTPNTLIAT